MNSVPAIVKWTHRHQQVVALHIAGTSGLRIAKILGITKDRVSQIITDPKAMEMIATSQKALRLKMQEDLEDRLVTLAEESADRLQETIQAEFLLGSKSKIAQDNVALSILKGTGFLSKDLGVTEHVDRPPLNERLSERLINALEASNEAHEVNNIEVQEVEVIEDEPKEATG